MSIQINQQLFMPRLKEWCETRRQRYEDNSVDLGREVLEEAQGWFDLEPWKSGRTEHFDTKRECRIELKRHIMKKVDLNDMSRSYFVPSFVWTWIAHQVITYIVKLIIDTYWEDIPT
jgi:hypothetical protein|tara:strand:- start:154 stop:504 length:351 start_codon:yes stop_codon:yes gene_type:complete